MAYERPDYGAEWDRRRKIWLAMQNDYGVRAAAMKFYATNPAAWISDFVVTTDPRLKIKTMPFMLFPRQRQFLTFLLGCIEDQEAGLVEKSRDAGATWICAAWSVWAWLFIPYISIGWGSRKALLVDRGGDPDSIFEKMRLIIGYLPNWMIPEHTSAFMKLVNLQTGATITGEAGDNIGRGGRKTVYFKDESAHYEHPELVEAALSANTETPIDISSVNGAGNVFHRKRSNGIDWGPDVVFPPGITRVFVFDWRDDPRKTQEWYDLRRAKFENDGLGHIFAQEFERDYSGATTGIIIPNKWVQAAIGAAELLGIPLAGERIAAQDVADGGGDRNAFSGRIGVTLRRVEAWGGDAGDAAPIALQHCVEMGIRELYYDSIGVGAGFKTGMNVLAENGRVPDHLTVEPWNAGAAPLDPEGHVIEDDEDTPTNEDQYSNLKAQSWFRMRTRFYKTFKAVTQGEKHPLDDLISLDPNMANVHALASELSQATYKYNSNGKTIVDKAPPGTRSPNLADSAVMCFNPTRPEPGWFTF